MKVYVLVWSLSGHVRVVGVYTDYNTAEETVVKMQRNNTQGWIKILESEINENINDQEIKKGQTWYKKTPSWCGDNEEGTPVIVKKYKDGWVWYKKSFFGEKFGLNEFSFRRIFAR